MDESKEGPLIQQFDVAVAPERKSKPKRAIIVLASAFAGLFLGVLVAFVRRAIYKVTESEEGAAQMARLKRAWNFKR